MPDQLKKMQDLMDETLNLFDRLIKKYKKDPLRALDYVIQLKEHFEAIKEINENDENFDSDEVSDEFIETLENFLKVTEEHRLDEKSPYHNLMNREEILQILVDLERRHKSLTE